MPWAAKSASNPNETTMHTKPDPIIDSAWIIVGAIVYSFAILFYSAFVASKVWTWTMPVLFDLPALNVAQMFALRIVVSALFDSPRIDTADPNPIRSTFLKLLMWTFLLGLGAVASSYI